MLKRLFFFLILTLFLLVPAAQAQGPLQIDELAVDLWPEYDRPSVLVIYHLKLPANITLPAQVVLRIPASAGNPHAVAVRQMDGSLFNAAYERQVDGEWAMITITATMPEIQMEYYDPQIADQDGMRQYQYIWPGDYAVTDLRISVQQPMGATQMQVVPDLGTFVQPSGDPMQYYVMDVGSPKAGEEVRVGVSYFKDSDALSVENFQVQPSAPINGNTGEQSGIFEFLPWLIGGLGVVLLFAGGLWYWRLNKTETSAAAPRRSRPASTIKTPEQVAAENHDTPAIYCHQCGKRAAAGDRFCRTCGTRLRAS